jgi:hypothetical protein
MIDILTSQFFKSIKAMGITAGTILIIIGTTLIALGKAINEATDNK